MRREVKYLAQRYTARRWALAHKILPERDWMWMRSLGLGGGKRVEAEAPGTRPEGPGWQGKPTRLRGSHEGSEENEEEASWGPAGGTHGRC